MAINISVLPFGLYVLYVGVGSVRMLFYKYSLINVQAGGWGD